MKTVAIQGKNYVPVSERLKEFRAKYPAYSLRSELVSVDAEHALIKAVIRDEADRIIAEGTAFETAGSSFINKSSHVENSETSAFGRALGNFGIGIDASVATADEVANAIANQNKPKAPADSPRWTPDQAKQVEELCKSTGVSLKQLYAHYKIAKGFPTPEQAATMILQLKKKLDDQLNIIASIS